jgi:hypothetical protein
MRLPRIEISSRLGTIDIRTRAAKIEGTPPYLTARVSGNAGAKVEMDITHPRIQIDSSPSRESMGIYKTFRHIEKFAAEGNQRAIQQIGRIAREGLQIMKIEQGGGWNAARQIAKNKGMKGPPRLTIKAVTPPNISAQPGTVSIRDASQKVRTTVQEGADTTRYTPATIAISWRTVPTVDFTFIPGSQAGINVDEFV